MRSKTTTAKMIHAGLLLIEGKAASTYEALVAAGYSPNTARNPGANGLCPARLIREAVKAGAADPFACLQRFSTQAMRDFDAQPGQASAFRAEVAQEAARTAGDGDGG